MSLPGGVRLLELTSHVDERGVFTELFRSEWPTGIAPVQWNAVRSEPGVLRGVHVHARHDDYLTVPIGRATVGLCDLRPDSPTSGLAVCATLGADAPAALVIPHGVAHGFLFHEPSLHVYAVSHTWDPADELGCRWDDPGLGIPWPSVSPRLSDRDEALPALPDLRAQLAAAT